MTTAYDDPESFERVPPNNTYAEQSVLGGMMLSPQAILDAAEELAGVTEAFYRPAHQAIFNAIVALTVKGEPADPITVTDYLIQTGQLVKVGGAPYLHECVNAIPTAANTGYYAAIVRNMALLRKIIETGTSLVQMGYEGRTNPDQAAEVLDAAAAKLQALTASVGTKSDTREWKLDRVLEHVMDEYDHPSNNALPLPWSDLELGVPMEPGDLVVIGARPGIGKTVVLMDIARHVAIKHGRRVLVASMEMSHLQIGQRVISAEATAGLHHIRQRMLGEETRKRIDEKVGEIFGAPLYIDDRPARTLSSWRSRLRQLQAKDTLPAALIVDYLQIAKSETTAGTNRTGEVDAIAAGLKALAQEFGIVVIAAAQVNRALTQRTDKTPTLADLRESGGIEANANVVILLHREDAYEKESARSGEMDFIIAKNRMGPSNIRITAAFQGHYARAVDMRQA
jgi:replicative DNA helicase